ncbi:MAG: BRCT domain-containing protein [bacterium]
MKKKVAIICDNINCSSQIQRKIEHFSSRQAMNIRGLGQAIIYQLVKNNKIKDLADIYTLKKDELICLERMEEKSAQKLIDAINKSKNNSLEQFIFGLGIQYVGIHIAHILTSNFSSIDEISNTSKQEFEKIKGLGESIIFSLVEFFSKEEIKNLIQKFKDYGINTKSEKKLETKKLLLSGKIFVFTGELKKFSRVKASQLVINLGGTVSSSVNKNTSFLVCGENPGSKYQKAKSLGIKIIEESEFEKIINNEKIGDVF